MLDQFHPNLPIFCHKGLGCKNAKSFLKIQELVTQFWADHYFAAINPIDLKPSQSADRRWEIAKMVDHVNNATQQRTLEHCDIL